ncbi:MAG: alpha amylase C-terminal domain-containing protein, partial [Chloroflexi bacterium]|nr:alpha amylase C-terminal domain-containing protein [Chloroflexota bacterium]
WMHDTLQYMSYDPLFRKYHQNELTFRMVYAFTENFVLPLSHDEVTYGKGSLLGKMPGDEWRKFANLRLLLGYMFAQPGKKLLFMGDEFGQVSEWHHDRGLEWWVLAYPVHSGQQRWVESLNRLYRSEPALHELDFDPKGFEWIDGSDFEQSVISFLRKGRSPGTHILVACNFTPVPRRDYRIGVPSSGVWKEVLNSDAAEFGGAGYSNGEVTATTVAWHGRQYSLSLTLPPLAIIFLKWAGETTK